MAIASHIPRALGAVILALAAAASPAATAEEAKAPEAPAPQTLPPPRASMTRVHAAVRPFFNLFGAGWGALSEISVEHYFQSPWKVGVEVSPLALVEVPEGLGAIAHTRVRGAFASEYIEVGLGVGGRFQRFGPSGWSVAPALRLGRLDGLNLTAEIGSSLIRNYYTGRAQFAMSHVLGGLDVPLARGVAATLDVGYGVDLWVFTTLGLKQMIHGDGGPGTLVVGAGIGLVWIVDRFPCQYGDIDPCRGAAWGSGPTIAFSVDRRF